MKILKDGFRADMERIKRELTALQGESAKYMDGMFKNCVVAPAEVKAKGMEYFDDNEDLKTAEKLIAAIEQFLRS